MYVGNSTVHVYAVMYTMCGGIFCGCVIRRV